MRKFLLTGFLICLWISTTHAKDLYPISKHVLDNGMSVIISELQDNPMVSVYCLIKAGAATEGKYLGSGISHYVEHMLFKTTEKRGVGEIAKEIQAMGGDVNASTSLDFTIYTITVPYDKFDEALDVLADMMTSATFDPDEVEKERSVIHREMDLGKDNPRRRISRLAFRNVFVKHPYQHPTIGYKELFDKISRDELYDYYKSHYIPNNMVFSVAGNVKAEEIMPKIEKVFADFKRDFYPIRMLEQEPDQVTERFLEEEFEVPHVYLSMAYQGVRLMDEDLYALDVLAHILGQGKTSRLYKDLYLDQKIIYSQHVYNFTPVDKGAFEVDLQLEEKDVKQAMASVKEQIRLIQEKGVRPKELEITKEKVRTRYIYDNQHTSSVAWAQALDEAFTGNYKFSQKYTEEIAKVTNEDIKRVARKYLQDQRLSISVLKPKKEKDTTKKEKEEAPEIYTRKVVLDNGLTVLLRERHVFPLVSIRLSTRAGLAQEERHLQGVSNLTSILWQRGTRRYDFDALSELLESSGIHLNGISGNYSLGISLDTLPDKLDLTMDIMADLVFHPAFPEKYIDQLKDDVKQAIKQRDKTPYSLASYQLNKTMFPTHPFGLAAGGTEETLDVITRKDIVHFYKKHITPENMVLSIVGDFDSDKILKRIKKEYASLKKTDAQILSFTENPVTEPRHVEHRLDKDQAVVMFGFHGTTIFDDDQYKAKLTGAILGSSFSGRMFSNIRDKLSKAYTLGGGCSSGLDAGTCRFYITTTDENVETVIDLMKKEIVDLQSNLVADDELKNLKTYLKGINKSGRQTNYHVNSIIHYDELYGLGYDDFLNFDAYVDAVTKNDIQNMAQKYLDLDKMTISIVRPIEEKSDG